jgi:hypothetical protein
MKIATRSDQGSMRRGDGNLTQRNSSEADFARMAKRLLAKRRLDSRPSDVWPIGVCAYDITPAEHKLAAHHWIQNRQVPTTRAPARVLAHRVTVTPAAQTWTGPTPLVVSPISRAAR